MELAISKWETDREFVENYRVGEYTQFGVHAIFRRRFSEHIFAFLDRIFVL